jgi:hypothetical protein
MTDLKALSDLRKLIPIGLAEGQALLETHNGNVKQAAHLWKKEKNDALLQRGVPAAETGAWLALYDYDVDAAWKASQQGRMSQAQKIIASAQQTDALRRLATAVAESSHVINKTSKFWEITVPPQTPVETFWLLLQWLNHLHWESASAAFWSDNKLIRDQLANELHLPEIAAVVEAGAQRVSAIRQAAGNPADASQAVGLFDAVASDGQYARLLNTLEEKLPEIEKALMNYVKQNISAFP